MKKYCTCKKITIIGIGLLFLTISTNYIFCEEVRFDHYLDNNGLTHNSIRSIQKDNNGLLWIGTFGGVDVFDGYEFKNFNTYWASSTFLPDDDITCLKFDSINKNMWIGSNFGLSRINIPSGEATNFFHDSTDNSTISDNKIRSLNIDREGNVWIGTKEGGINVYNHEKQNIIRLSIDELSYVKSIFFDSSDNTWIGTLNQGIYNIRLDKFYNIKEIKKYSLTNNITNSKESIVYFFYRDSKNILWAGTAAGLYFYERLNHIFVKAGLQSENRTDIQDEAYRCILRDVNGKYWIGTRSGIIICKDLHDLTSGKYRYLAHSPLNSASLVNNYINVIATDPSGIVWIGTENGLDKYDPYSNQFISLNINNGGFVEKIAATCISNTHDSGLLLGTFSEGIFEYKNNRAVRIFDKIPNVSGIYTNDNINFWIGSWTGKLFYFNKEKNLCETYKFPGIQSAIVAIEKYDKNTLILGSKSDGIVLFNITSRSISNYRVTALKNIFNINKILNDNKGIIYIATDQELVIFNSNNGSIVKYHLHKQSNKKLNPSLLDLNLDKEGRIWIASREGLYYFAPTKGNIIKVREPSIINNIWVTDITIDKQGKLWLNLNYNQIAKFDYSTKIINFFDVKNGIRSSVYNKKGFYYGTDSLIYFSGHDETFFFNPYKLQKNNYSPLPLITELKIQNIVVKPNLSLNNQTILTNSIVSTNEITLKHENRNFSLTFVSPSFINPSKNGYKYILEGFEPNWNSVNSKNRSIQYTNLNSGQYTFKVMASNNNGVWSDIKALKIIIKRPLLMTNLAFIIYFTLILLIAWIARWIIVSKMKLKTELLLEKVKREKEEKLLQEKLRFFTNISHELKTPLTLILGPARQLLDIPVKSEVQKKFNLIHQNATRLHSLVTQILDFRKAEAGQLKLKVSESDVVKYTKGIYSLFKHMAEEKQITYEYFHTYDSYIGWIDTDKYDKILYNLLSNAFKYTTSKGTISVQLEVIKKTKDILRITIKDNGKGIPKKYHEKIFERFYQIPDNTNIISGTGIGLSMVKKLIDIHKGNIEVKSVPGEGTRFTVELPISKSEYERGEIFNMAEEKNNIPEIKIEAKPPGNYNNLAQKILIVEDHIELRYYIKSLFNISYQVIEAENGITGLKLARKHAPDIIITDVMMEKMDGFEFCKNVKNDLEISHIPIIILTALEDDKNRIQGYKLGADDYISKPFDPEILKTRVENLIDNRRLLKNKFSAEIHTGLDILSYSPVDDDFLSRVQNIIEENLTDPKLSTKMLSNNMNMSQSKFYRKLNKLTDLKPNDFIRTIRLKKATFLLKNKNYTISEVAYMVGFNDPLYFSKCFKKQFNLTPSDIRN